MAGIFNTVRESQLRAFWPTLQPLRVLAKEWSVSDAYISQQAKRLGLPSRKNRVVEIRRDSISRKFSGRIEGRLYFEEEARRRGWKPMMLERVLIGIIQNDRLVNALLDDAAELEAVA